MIKFIFRTLIFVSLLGIVYGFTIPNYDGYITDKVGVFSASEKADLTTKIQEIEKATSIEIAVLVVPTVDDDINLAAADVGNKRGVGKKGQNNGLVLLIAVDDRKRSIQVGYGLEGVLPDIIAKNIGESRFPPNFRAGNYYQGVTEMLDDVLGYIKQDPTIMQNYSQDSQQSSTSSSPNGKYTEFLILFFILTVSGFGRRITVPSAKGKGRKMKKYGRWIFAGAGILLSLVITRILANIVLSVFLSYIFLLMGTLSSLYSKTGTGRGGMWFGGGGIGGGGGGGSFGGFGGGGFGGGGGGGSW